MNGVEYRNLCDLAECGGLDAEDREELNRMLRIWRWGNLPDYVVAQVSQIRARAARAYHDGRSLPSDDIGPPEWPYPTPPADWVPPGGAA